MERIKKVLMPEHMDLLYGKALQIKEDNELASEEKLEKVIGFINALRNKCWGY